MGVFGCFGGTPEKQKIQSMRTYSPAKLEKALRVKRGYGKNPPVIFEHAETLVPEDDEEFPVQSGEDFSDVTINARPGGSSLSSCGSTNIPLKHAAAGVMAWAHVDELAEEVAELRRRLHDEEEHARRLAEEVVTLQSNAQDSGGEHSHSGSQGSGVSNQSVDPRQDYSEGDGLNSDDAVELKESSSNITTTEDDGSQPSSGQNGFEELDIQLPSVVAAQAGLVDDVAGQKQLDALPLLHTDEQWEKMIRQGSRSRTLTGKKSLSPRQRRMAAKQSGSAPPGPTRSASEDMLLMTGGEDDVAIKRSLFTTDTLPWASGEISGDNGSAEGEAQPLAQAPRKSQNLPKRLPGADPGEDAVVGDRVSYDSAPSLAPTLCMGVGVKGGGNGSSGDSRASADIQNLRGSVESESSFALVPPVSGPGLDPGLGFMDFVDSPSTYDLLERPAALLGESYSHSFSLSTPGVHKTAGVNEDQSCLTVTPPPLLPGVEKVTPASNFFFSLDTPDHKFPDYPKVPGNSPDLDSGVSHQDAASPSSVDEDVDIRGDTTDSSFESTRMEAAHLPPRSEMPFFPLTQDMLQVYLDNAEMVFENPVYADVL